MSQYAVPTYQSSVRSTTGIVKTGSGVLHAVYCNVALAGGAVTLTDGVGATILVLPSGWAAGSVTLKGGAGLDIAFATSLTATFAGSGSLTFIYR
jgi:hypothetical protein